MSAVQLEGGWLGRYCKAMVAYDGHAACASIEQRFDLYGYPPNIVCIGLKAIDEGRDPDEAIDAYLEGDDEGDEE